ncbi:hypothetical protein [Amycolatopsis keratiniphila]|uniref:Uncharacterized protein n=1 Tax=Amycolatopsis keratiniphila TaxID=129921 RepID=W6HZI7_9PSEU|nr:hypothetical protein [Amycolatopsis keratiniphila]AHJ58542.1 hypothetical protein AORI_P027 [Amycolatopsis keratiniphila]
MFDVIEGDTTVLAGGVAVPSASPVAEVVPFWQVDLEPYGEDALSDEQLLMVARLEFQELQLRRTRGEDEGGPVLGSYRRPVVVVDELDEVFEAFEDQADVYAELTDAALPGMWPAQGELAVRRERRMAAKTLRAAIGGVA